MIKIISKNLIVKLFSLTTVLLLTITLGLNLASAQTAPTPPATTGVSNASGGIGATVRQIGASTSLPSYDAGHADQNYESGASQITSTIYFILDFFKYIFGGIAVLMIIISGLKLILAGRTVDEAMNKEKETLRLSFIGLMIILIAGQLLPLFFGQEGEIYRTGTDLTLAATKATTFTQGLTGLIRIFIPSIAVLYMVVAGYRLMLSRGDAEKMTKAKTQVTWAIIGLIVAGLDEVVIFQILFPNNGSQIPDPAAFTKTIITMTNFVTGFISTIAVSLIIYAGYIYVTSLGGEGVDKAKKILTGAIIGLLISMAAFGLVNTFVKIPNAPAGTPTVDNGAKP
jgi:hypothetical protein